MTDLPLIHEPPARRVIVPRDYQIEAHDGLFRLWDEGETGVLLRAATGTGKTVMATMAMRTWLDRGGNRRCIVISYENELVWQFAQEVEEFLGVPPGIEMGSERVDTKRLPQVVVASRQSLCPKTTADKMQRARFAELGFGDVGAVTKKQAATMFRALDKEEITVGDMREEIARINESPEACGHVLARVNKFDPLRYDWLVVMDEAHRFSHTLAQVAWTTDWFARNQNSRRCGITATPRRTDGKSIGHKMFPGIALDYPLYRHGGKCAVSDGWCVAYEQRYIAVEGLDFKQMAKVAGDFDVDKIDAEFSQEAMLAKLVEPLLELVGDRPTLVFCPGVETAQQVARYINARVETKCDCGKVRWYGAGLIPAHDDLAAVCDCGATLENKHITKRPGQAAAVWGEIPVKQRREIYAKHRRGDIQLLVTCNLLREGFDSPTVACVAIFRPISKKASSLAEQLKGRSCRPLRGVVDGLSTPEERRAAIAASGKPAALIIDLVGVSSLEECASTAAIYTESLPDEVREKAEELLEQYAQNESVPVDAVIDMAIRKTAEDAQRIREEREAAEARAREDFERRANAEARVTFSTHQVGCGLGTDMDPNMVSEKQLHFIEGLGMEIRDQITKRQAGRIIDMLMQGTDPTDVAYENRLKKWSHAGPSVAQRQYLRRLNGIAAGVKTRYEASQAIGCHKSPEGFVAEKCQQIAEAKSHPRLDRLGRDVQLVAKLLSEKQLQALVSAGRNRRASLDKEAF